MASIKCKVQLDDKKLKDINVKAKKSMGKVADKIKEDIINAEVIPYNTGATQDSLNVDVDEKNNNVSVSMSVNTPYAERLYYSPENDFRKDKNKNARSHWFDPWINGERKDDVKQYFSKEMKK